MATLFVNPAIAESSSYVIVVLSEAGYWRGRRA
jgi:hypothetical protein